MTRTHDLLITNQLLYRLSYASKTRCPFGHLAIIANFRRPVKSFARKKRDFFAVFLLPDCLPAPRLSVCIPIPLLCFRAKRIPLTPGPSSPRDADILKARHADTVRHRFGFSVIHVQNRLILIGNPAHIAPDLMGRYRNPLQSL